MNEVVSREEIKKKVIEALKQVFDPEIPINIWDLGLIYDIKITDDLAITIDYTLTTPFCPLAGVLHDFIIEAIKEKIPEAKKVTANLIYEPQWTPLKMTREGRELFKAIYGFDIVEEWLKKQKEKRIIS